MQNWERHLKGMNCPRVSFMICRNKQVRKTIVKYGLNEDQARWYAQQLLESRKKPHTIHIEYTNKLWMDEQGNCPERS